MNEANELNVLVNYKNGDEESFLPREEEPREEKKQLELALF